MEISLPGSLERQFKDHSRSFTEDPLSFLGQQFEKYGEVFQAKVFGLPNVFMIGPDAARFVLQDRVEDFSAREGNLQVAQDLFGMSLLFQDGEIHKETREAIAPAFYSRAIERYFNTMAEVIHHEINGCDLTKPIDVFQLAQRVTLQIVTRTLLGVSLVADRSFVQSNINDLACGLYASNRIGLPWTRYGKGIRARRRLQRFFAPLIRLYREETPGEPNLLSLLISSVKLNGLPLTDEEVMDQVNTFLFAGYDTSSSLMAWAVWHILTSPESVTELLWEIRSIPDTTEITFESVRKLRYLDCVVKETERLRPPVYFIPRMAMNSVTYRQYLIPKGWLVNVVPLLSHRLPNLFSDPERFDPKRFLPPREEHKQTPLALMGFGAGPKTCIGYTFAQLEVKLFLLMLLRSYDLTLRTESIEADWIPSLHPRRGPIVSGHKTGIHSWGKV